MSKELKALAEAATPGPWGWDGPVWGYDAENEAPWLIQERGSDVVITGELQCSEANAAYISAADPATVLSLIAERDALLAERDALEAQVNALHRGIKAKLPGRRLAPVGSGALHAEQNYCYRRGWKDGVAALRSQIRAALQGEQP